LLSRPLTLLAHLHFLSSTRNTDNVPVKSYKNITEDVTLNFVLQDWERWFDKNKRQPNVAAVIEKIQHGGNLWAWYQSQEPDRTAIRKDFEEFKCQT
jgi:hypothetical protein